MDVGAALHVEMALRSLAAPLPPAGTNCAGSADDDDLGPPSANAQCGEGTAMEAED